MQAAEHFKHGANQLEGMNNALRQSIHKMSMEWEGMTRERFFGDFQKASREMKQTLEHMHEVQLELTRAAIKFQILDGSLDPNCVNPEFLPAGITNNFIMCGPDQIMPAPKSIGDEIDGFLKGAGSGAKRISNSIKETAVNLYEDPINTAGSMFYNATIGTAEYIINTAVWGAKMTFDVGNTRGDFDKQMAGIQSEIDEKGWSAFLGQQTAMGLSAFMMHRVGIKPKLNMPEGGSSGGSNGSSSSGSGGSDSNRDGTGDSSDNGGKDGKPDDENPEDKTGNEGTGKAMGNMINDIRTKTPDQLLKEGWKDVTDPRKAQNTMSREYYNPETGVKISYDPGKKGATGFEAVDHYHVHNPNYTDKKVDYYFDIDGNPVGKGSKASHIVIKDGE
ncbi:WXG100 family type VII secretion target protein [Paenibacillus algicola]|uniref:WXG100 family type VII secretion target protein n=2 Tax=Paenibacillus TaxID=44249 RepID=A0A4P8XFZ6_9BACL|nr:WXG100 family type VII secretion target [Paenibacillus algicola]QCT01013.1 WXG100 family type VII secretion target protein [Paenibacillus algicola]